MKSFQISSNVLWDLNELRFDASSFNPDAIAAIDKIRNSGMNVATVGSLVSSVFFPNRFKRVYVNSDVGVPFLQGSHVVHFKPAGLQYLSQEAHKNLDTLLIRAGWILITRSGTVARVTLCPTEWDGWAASEHIFRVIPDENKCSAGYLCSFLASPFGQLQLNARIYGGQVDELTVEHIRGILVPLPRIEEDFRLIEEADRSMRAAIDKKSEAVALMDRAITSITERIEE